jgi:hypothetical protein
MMDVLVGSIDGAPGERFSVYLRTVRGRRVVSFEVSGKGNEMPDSVMQLSVADLGKLQPLICGAVVRAEDEQRGARW